MSAERSEAGLVSSKTTQGVGLPSFCPTGEQAARALGRIRRLRRAVWASGHLHGMAEKGFRPAVAWFVTLTYAQADAWQAEHIKKAFERYRQWCRRAGHPCRYTWVAEIQPKRAQRTGKHVVHYHLLAWLPQGVSMPFWDQSPDHKRPPFWTHGMSERDVAKSGVGYLMKYLSKLGAFHRFPKGLRLYGIGGLESKGRAVRSWLNLPEWAKRLHGVGELKRIPSSRLVVRETGEILASPYRVERVPGGFLVHLVGSLAERFHDGAYSRYPVQGEVTA